MHSLTGPAVNNHYYRIMQFYAVPSQTEQNEMKKLGILFFDYIPKNAFMVSIPKGITKAQLSKFGIRSIATVKPEMKLTKILSTEGVPSWAKNEDGSSNFVVGFYENITKAQVQAYLHSLKATFTRKEGRFYKVTIETNSLTTLLKSDLVYYVQEADPRGEPETFRAKSNHRTNTLQQNFPGGMQYDGDGVLVAIGDDGNLFSHVDYTGRLVFQTAVPNGGNHGEMVAGIVFGAGNINPPAKGMAPGADVAYFDYFNQGDYYLDGTDTMYNNMGAVITQSSYSNGTNAGYTQLCRQMDEDVIQNRALMHVFSAGNAGPNAYTITGGHKQGKNVIATANLTWDDGLNNSSSRGPAHDGRVKPDMGAVGTSVLTTNENNLYRLGGGTSSAAPGVSGNLAALYQAYKENNGQALPDGGLMKSILMNTAEDLGNPGPDFNYGYGRINARRAVNVIENNTFYIDSIVQGETDTISLTVGANIAEMRVMLYWSDAPASVNTARALVNDLNFTVLKGTNAWQPWVLNPNTPNNNAVRSTDSLNNAEQITLKNPANGEYKLVVNGATIPTGPQKYYVVYSLIPKTIDVTHPIGGEHFTPKEQEIIRWDAPEGTGTFSLEYSIDNGVTWNSINTSVASNLRYFLWTVPNNITGEARVRVSRGAETGESLANFSIIGVPTGLAIVWACQDSLMMRWDAVPGATSYEVSLLGQKYMDSVGTTTSTQFKYTGLNTSISNWLSVKALGPNGCVGERAYAIEKTPGLLYCTPGQDALISEITSPATPIPSCQPLNGLVVKMTLVNGGIQALYNIPVAYAFNNTIVRDTVLDTIAQGMSYSHTFSSPFSAPGPGTFQIRTFTELANDQNTLNDTLAKNFSVISGVAQTLPYAENFDSFAQCGTASNCEATNCGLSNGWYNSQNLVGDDVDFRTNSGGTPSQGTGPTGDHTSGTGNYLYIEASGTCANREGYLLSPCFDLSTAVLPEASVWYHMLGTALGELHVDVLADGELYTDVVPAIVGDQGSSWVQLKINLGAFTGKTVNVRFRGVTGSSWSSDIALDDFSIDDMNIAPTPNFSSNTDETCVQKAVSFTDLSQPAPTAWSWTITPATYTFVNGTNATSQNPEVEFTALGSYSVKLAVSNIFGTDSITKANTIAITSGAALPIAEDFSGVVPSNGWTIINPDSDETWERSTPIAGSNNTPTNALWINNFNYNASGQEDIFQSPPIDLNGQIDPYLTFDVSHAQYDATYNDGLRIEISTDCGTTFDTTRYRKVGPVLATAPDQTTIFSPTSASEWRADTLDLTPYVNATVVIQFIAECGYGNSLYIDNINIRTDNFISLSEDVSFAENIQIAPNPAADMVFLKANFKAAKDVGIEVLDISGKTLVRSNWQNAAQGNDYPLDLSSVAEGVYLVRFTSDAESATKRIVIRK